MFVADYCSWVQEGVWRAWLAGEPGAFAACGPASAASLYALMGDDDEALAIAEPLAERYFDYLLWAADPEFQGAYGRRSSDVGEGPADGR